MHRIHKIVIKHRILRQFSEKKHFLVKTRYFLISKSAHIPLIFRQKVRDFGEFSEFPRENIHSFFPFSLLFPGHFSLFFENFLVKFQFISIPKNGKNLKFVPKIEFPAKILLKFVHSQFHLFSQLFFRIRL